MAAALLIAVFARSQPTQVGAGEYYAWLLNLSTHKVVDMSAGVPAAVPGAPLSSQVACAYHHCALTDLGGNAWTWGNNTNGQIGNGTAGGGEGGITVTTCYEVTTDINGKPFTGIAQVVPGASAAGYFTMALKNDGTVWIWGLYNGAVITRPTQIVFPAGAPAIKKIQGGFIYAALDVNGGVWTWGLGAYNVQYMLAQGTATPNTTTPTKIPLPVAAVDIACGSQYMNYAQDAQGNLYGWGAHPSYYGFGTSYATEGPFSLVPRLINAQLGLPLPVKQITCSSVASYAILTDGSLWVWGDGSNGTIGNGLHLNFATYKDPYDWDWGPGELMQITAVQIAPGKSNFVSVFTSQQAAFYAFAEDANNQLYSWGRNKGRVLGNGIDAADSVIGQQSALLPNSWDVPTITAVNPLALTKTLKVTSPWCITHPTAQGCPVIKPGPPPISSAGPNQTITGSIAVLNGTASTGQIQAYAWVQTGGPAVAVVISTGATATVSGLVPGTTYTFQLTVTDIWWQTSTSTVTITVQKPSQPPTTVIEPFTAVNASSATGVLNGSGTTDPQGLPLTYQWTQVSGPGTATIATPTAALTSVIISVAGSYTFQLTATSSAGLSSSQQVTVTATLILLH